MQSNRYSYQNLMKLNFLNRLSKKLQTSNVIKIRPVGTEMFRADERTGRHDEAKSRFPQFRERT
jgi:hypothetical protein